MPDPLDPNPGETPSWNDGMTSEISAHDRMKEFTDINALAQAYIDSPKATVIPTAQEYQIPEDILPSNFREFANTNSFTQDQVTKLAEYQKSNSTIASQAQEVENSQNLEKLYVTWGDSKETNLSLANQALVQYDKENHLIDMLESSGAIKNPTVINFFYNLGKSLKEDGFLKSEINSPKPQSAAEVLYPNQGKD